MDFKRSGILGVKIFMFGFFGLGGCKIFRVVPIIVAGLGEVCLFRRSWIGGVLSQKSLNGELQKITC